MGPQFNKGTHLLVVAAHEGILAPAGHEAASAVEVFKSVGQTDRVDVGTAKGID